MRHKFDIENWERKEQYDLFSQYEEPYFGVTVNIDCTLAYRAAKEADVSFFLYYLYQALAASQHIEAFRYRIEENEVVIYDRIDAGSTVGRSNGTFGFGHFFYDPDFDQFIAKGKTEIDRVENATHLLRPEASNIIRCSSLPWIDFTSLSHARRFSVADSCPRISFGKMTENNGKRSMPVSIHVNHALVDGLHVGQYIDCFQQLMDGEMLSASI